MKRGYVSDFTRFIDEYVATHPGVLEDQRRGRAIYWDKRVDFVALAEAEEDSVPTESYYYFSHPGPREAAPREEPASPDDESGNGH